MPDYRLLLGDLDIGHHDIDHAIPTKNKQSSYVVCGSTCNKSFHGSMRQEFSIPGTIEYEHEGLMYFRAVSRVKMSSVGVLNWMENVRFT